MPAKTKKFVGTYKIEAKTTAAARRYFNRVTNDICNEEGNPYCTMLDWKEDKPLFLVTWEGRDGDGAAVVRAKDATAALKAACPQGSKLFLNLDFEFITGTNAYVTAESDGSFISRKQLLELEPDHTHGVFLCGAYETTIIEA